MKGIIIFVTGALVGAGGTYLYLHTKFEAQYAEERRSLTESFKNMAEQMNDDSKKTAEKGLQSVTEASESDNGTNYNDISKKSGGSGENRKRIVIDHLAGHEPYPGEDDEEVPYEEQIDIGERETEEHQREKFKEPYVVSIDEFGNDPNYESKEYFYYCGDDTLTDENDEAIDDIKVLKSVIGHCLDDWKTDYYSRNIYIRSPKLGIEAEITKLDGSFKDVYTG